MRRVKLRMIRVHGHYKVQFTRLFVEIACAGSNVRRPRYFRHTEKFIYIYLSSRLYMRLLKIERVILFIFFKLNLTAKYFLTHQQVSLKYFFNKIHCSFRALTLCIFLQFFQDQDSSRLIAASDLQLNNEFTTKTISLQVWVKRLHRTCNFCRGVMALQLHRRKSVFTLLIWSRGDS